MIWKLWRLAERITWETSNYRLWVSDVEDLEAIGIEYGHKLSSQEYECESIAGIVS